jgi:hypothetical protein
MPKLTREFVKKALDAQSIWDLGNEVLYKVYKDHPGHGDDNVIIAKTLLIGRVYAVSLERRRNADVKGDAFYINQVANAFRKSEIDKWFRSLKEDAGGSQQKAIETHKKLTVLLQSITDFENRSFASKYLHFHFPARFYIFDSRAEKSASKLARLDRGRIRLSNADPKYSDFCARCDQLNRCMQELIGRVPSPREVDKVLLHWEREKSEVV